MGHFVMGLCAALCPHEHDTRQHATTPQPQCRGRLRKPPFVGRCCWVLPDVGRKCPMSVPWTILSSTAAMLF